MRRKSTRVGLFAGVLFLAIIALADGDKYTVRVPGGLSFSEFRGYESWPTVSVSRNERVLDVIVGNPQMIAAFQAGFPGNGEPAPDGAKMAKIHWTPKPNEFPTPAPTLRYSAAS